MRAAAAESGGVTANTGAPATRYSNSLLDSDSGARPVMSKGVGGALDAACPGALRERLEVHPVGDAEGRGLPGDLRPVGAEQQDMHVVGQRGEGLEEGGELPCAPVDAARVDEPEAGAQVDLVDVFFGVPAVGDDAGRRRDRRIPATQVGGDRFVHGRHCPCACL